MNALLPSLETFVRVAGFSQLALVAVTATIPWLLDWKTELSRVSTFTRRHHFVYAAYIVAINTAFGLLSAFAPHWLLDGSSLATAVCGAIAVYWGARLIIQFACFGGVAKRMGKPYQFLEAALVSLFLGLTATYGAAFASHWWSFLG